ncbi:MAG: glycosyltransferase family 2 protein [SAR324 cluster bacterium]
MLISFVIPVCDEAETLRDLTLGVRRHVQPHPHEIVFVDDGSRDGSLEVIKSLAREFPEVQYIAFRRNFGKSAALDAGFDAAKGEIVFTMDADLQDDPAEIPAFLAKLGEGFDLVSGWKKERHDPLGKTLPSKVFNWTARRLTGVKLHDMNCGFKAYRSEVVRELTLYGDLHRFVPALAHWRGFRVGELPVRHHPRRFGTSKFGVERFLRGLFDLITVYFLTSYTARPMHLFGKVGLITGALGALGIVYLYALKFLTGSGIGSRPLLFISIFLMGTGIQIFLFGLITELIVSQKKRTTADYSIRERS